MFRVLIKCSTLEAETLIKICSDLLSNKYQCIDIVPLHICLPIYQVVICSCIYLSIYLLTELSRSIHLPVFIGNLPKTKRFSKYSIQSECHVTHHQPYELPNQGCVTNNTVTNLFPNYLGRTENMTSKFGMLYEKCYEL